MHKVSKLKNGLTLITVPVSGTRATTVLIMVPVGSRYEHREISGVSHFVEHMMFKGTKKRPTALEISKTLDAVGAEYNAFTGKEYTGYYVKIDGAKQELAFDLLSDMLFNSEMDAAEMEREKGVIVEELRMYEDNPSMIVNLIFDRLVFGDCPLGWDEGGTKESVKKMTRENLFKYYKAAYEPGNMVMVIAGNVNGTQLKKLTDKYYAKEKADAKKDQITKKDFIPFVWPKEKLPLADRVVVEEKTVDQAHMILGFPAFKNDDDRRYAESILLYILGGGMSSRLFVEVREKRGLAYMVHAGSSNFRDAGMVFVRAGLNPARLHEAVKVIKDELNKIVINGVTKQELIDAKNSISGRMALAMEESNAQAEWFAKQFWFMKKMDTPDDVLKKINKVTLKQVQDAAKIIFDFTKLRAAVIGPVKKGDFLKML